MRYVDRNGNDISFDQFCRMTDERVAVTKMDRCTVSTVWVGVDAGDGRIFETAVIVVGGVLTYTMLGRGEGTIAVISVNGEELERIDLSKVRKAYDIDVTTEYGHNIVHVEPGAISVTEADCPDQICVFQGKLTGSGIPIICMPHRLVIEIEGGDLDA